MFTAGSACTGMYRGLKFWEAAVREAGSLVQADVIAALDHASIAEGPGGPAEMVPGQHHVRMNMYIAQARDGQFRIVESLGMIDPKEGVVGRRGPTATASPVGRAARGRAPGPPPAGLGQGRVWGARSGKRGRPSSGRGSQGAA